MRSDMEKVIIDCARHNHRDTYKDKTGDNGLRHNRDWVGRSRLNSWENHPKREKVGTHRTGTKGQCDRLNPIIRFLRSRVGKNWDKTYSEIAKIISRAGTMQQHVWGHIEDFVSYEMENKDGRWLVGGGRYSSIRSFEVAMSGFHYSNFYVDLRGILREVPHTSRSWKREPRWKTVAAVEHHIPGGTGRIDREWPILHLIDKETYLSKWKGAWFEVKASFDVDTSLYGASQRRVVSKRTLSKKEIRAMVPKQQK